MSKKEITAIVNAITELVTALRYATPADKAEIYAGLSVRLTDNPGPGPRTVTAQADISHTCTKGSCPRGDLNPHTPFGALAPQASASANSATRTCTGARQNPCRPHHDSKSGRLRRRAASPRPGQRG